MRIRRFDLRAYGHFTNVSLELAPGLNILYGDNEAGKSTSLRALGQLLFGFTAQSGDDFLHPYKSMRLGGLFEQPDGGQFYCIRRKSRVDSLRAEDDVAVLPPDTIDKLLGGIERPRFESQFGINYEQLVAGGREICSGKGDLGEILFAAASGVSHLGRILRQLEDEVAGLFNPSGNATKASINKCLSERTKKLKEVRERQIPSSVWDAQVQALEYDREKLRHVQSELRRVEGERERLRRLRQALPLMVRRDSLLEQQARLAAAPLLAAGFEERRFKLQSEQIAAQARRNELDEAVSILGRKAGELSVPEDLLQRAPRIQQLNQDLGSYLKAQRDRHRLEGQLNQLNSGIQAGLLELDNNKDNKQVSGTVSQTVPDNFISGVSRQQKARINKLAKDGLGLVIEVQNRDERRQQIERDITRLSSELERQAAVPVVDELRAAVANVQNCGNLAGPLAQKRTILENARRQAELDLAALGLWPGGSATGKTSPDALEKLEELPVPALETIDRFDSEMSAAAAQSGVAERQLRESQQQRDELSRRLAQFRIEHDVPGEADLHEARVRRDADWRLVRESLSSPPLALNFVQAFELSLARADDIADRLRRDADLVAQKAQLLSDQSRQQQTHERLEAELADLESRRRDATDQWKSLWQPSAIEPLPPREMRAWINRRTQLVERSKSVREQAVEVLRLATEVAGHANRLHQLLAQSGQPVDEGLALAELTALAVDYVKRVDEAGRIRMQREESLRERNAELAEAGQLAQAALDASTAWRGQWAACMQVLALSGEASIEEATAVLESIDAIMAQQGKAQDLAERIQGIDAEAAEFQSGLAAILDDMAPDLRLLPVEQSLAQLVERLDAAQEARTRREELKSQQQEREQQLVDAGETLRRCQAGLAVLCQEAGCSSADDLPTAERASRERQQAEKELSDVHGRLAELAVGKNIDDLVRQAGECEPDLLGARIAELESELAGRSQQRDDLLTAAGGKETALALMDGSGKAADAQAEAEALLAQVRADAERYVRLKLAASVLRETMEQFRQKNQGPILELASRVFTRLTLGSFCGLRVELNDQGAPTLLGVRTGATTVPLDGMSDGTSDQLFLALRIASLENYFRDHAPMPFVVDDILIKFDDDRAVAALETLHELAQHTQVVMFTHHRHLLDLAMQRLPEGACSVSHVALPASP